MWLMLLLAIPGDIPPHDPCPWFRTYYADRREVTQMRCDLGRTRDWLRRNEWRWIPTEHAAALKEVEWQYSVFDALEDAWCPHASDEWREDAARRLRRVLGEDDYYSGRLPVPSFIFEGYK